MNQLIKKNEHRPNYILREKEVQVKLIPREKSSKYSKLYRIPKRFH